MNCQSCDSLFIQGVFCHETGCPDSNKDEHGNNKPVACWVCGCDFIPEESENVCYDCQNPIMEEEEE